MGQMFGAVMQVSLRACASHLQGCDLGSVFSVSDAAFREGHPGRHQRMAPGTEALPPVREPQIGSGS